MFKTIGTAKKYDFETKKQIINYIIYYQVKYNIIVSINMQNAIEMHVNIHQMTGGIDTCDNTHTKLYYANAYLLVCKKYYIFF